MGAAVPENVCEGAGEEGGDADTETRRALAQGKVQQQAVAHLAWQDSAGVSLSRGDSAQPAAEPQREAALVFPGIGVGA